MTTFSKFQTTAIAITSISAFYFCFNYFYKSKKAENRIKDLEEKLKLSKKEVSLLQESVEIMEKRLNSEPSSPSLTDNEDTSEKISLSGSSSLDFQSEPNSERPIRLFLDGVFDVMHYGHMNAFRQAKALGTYLIAGVVTDEAVTAVKGPPVCSEKERIDTVRGCKFVDDVVGGVPYMLSEEFIKYIIETYEIDYWIHGDDPCIVDGKNAYEYVIKLGKYRTIPRTEGISTTDIVGRLLETGEAIDSASNVTKVDGLDYSLAAPASSTITTPSASTDDLELKSEVTTDHTPSSDNSYYKNYSPISNKSQFLTTYNIIQLFGSGMKTPKPDQKIVYIGGAWDMFHAGHVEALERAKAAGDFLIVGVYSDYDVNKLYGMNLPILSLHERVLSVLGCKFVDDVLISAPLEITKDMVSSLRISKIINAFPRAAEEKGNDLVRVEDLSQKNLYKQIEHLNIVENIYVDYNISALNFVERVSGQKEKYQSRFKNKMAAEREFYNNKYGYSS